MFPLKAVKTQRYPHAKIGLPAWLPESLVEGDLASGALVRAGDPSWDLELEIQLHRLAETDSPVVSKIWNILQSLLVP
jgi:DNA-binding transcriptional LysR family regulator